MVSALGRIESLRQMAQVGEHPLAVGLCQQPGRKPIAGRQLLIDRGNPVIMHRRLQGPDTGDQFGALVLIRVGQFPGGPADQWRAGQVQQHRRPRIGQRGEQNEPGLCRRRREHALTAGEHRRDSRGDECALDLLSRGAAPHEDGDVTGLQVSPVFPVVHLGAVEEAVKFGDQVGHDCLAAGGCGEHGLWFHGADLHCSLFG